MQSSDQDRPAPGSTAPLPPAQASPAGQSPAGTGDLTEDLQLAHRLADAADLISMSRFLASDLVVATKPDLTPVTEADQAVERTLRSILASERPDDRVLGEEYGGTRELSGRHWIIDPIDATKNYVRGVPVWATLVGLVVDGRAVLGIASAPALGRRWWAAAGAGAFTSDAQGVRQLRVSAVGQLSDASLSISDGQGWPAGALADLGARVWRQRAYGDFWSHLLVAEGAVDVAAEPELNIWDVAALIPIVLEAGGSITGFDGTAALGAGSAVTTNGLLDAQVHEVLRPGSTRG